MSLPFLRCSSCGAKALAIATRCPACSEPIRHGEPGSGSELAALRPCPRCDSLLPKGTTPCPWCGEVNTQRRPTALVAGLVVLLMAGVGGGLFLLTKDSGRESGPSPVAVVAPSPVAEPSAAVRPPEAEAETSEAGEPEPPAQSQAQPVAPASTPAPAPAVAAAALPTPPPAAPATSPPASGATNPSAPPPAAGASAPPTTATAAAGTAPAAAGAAPAPNTPTSASWTWVVAGNYANVRSAGNSEAAILGTIAPGDSIQIEGGSRTWRQVRRGSLSGWVWVEALNIPGNR
jgi:hypothetical protein